MVELADLREPVKVEIDNRVRVHCGSNTPLAEQLKQRFTHDNPDYAQWKTFRRGGPPPKKIETWRTEGRGKVVTVPRGGMADVRELIRAAGFSLEIEDHTTDQLEPGLVNVELRDPLWSHQGQLVDSFCGANEMWSSPEFRNGLWRAPQGSGKTQAVLELVLRLQSKTLIVVSTGSLFEQWSIRVQRELGFEPGQIRAQRRDIGPPIVIGMAQTLAKCAHEYANTFGFVCLDESQIAGAQAIQEVMDVFTARYRLGVSGDERRADRKEFLTYDIFGPVTCEVKREVVEATGEVVDVEIRIVPTDFRADWYVALGADDPTDERQRVRAARAKVEHRARLLEELTNDDDRNLLAVETSLDASEPFYTYKPRHQFVILSDRREQCHRLDALLAARSIRSGLFIGGADYAQQFQLTLAGMRNGSLTAGVGTYQAIGVGFEAHRELAIGVAASPCVFNDKSRMQFNQYRGRFARSAPGKDKGVFYYLWDRHVYGINPVRLLCRWNKTVKVQTPDGWVEGKRFLRDA